MTPERPIIGTWLRSAAMIAACVQLVGCNVDSFFNPSVTGYWETTATTVPILERLDIIEEGEDYWAQASEVTPEDLIPSDLSYRMAPGDFVSVQIFDLYGPGQSAFSTRRIDPGGFLRVSELGDVQAAGLTPEEFKNAIEQLLEENVITRPQVEVVIEEGGGFHYTVYGNIPGPGLYTLRRSDLRLMDALAVAGGTPVTTEVIYIIRQVELSEEVKPTFDRDQPSTTEPAPPDEEPPVDIEDLIDRLDDSETEPRPGMLRQDGDPIVDIDDLEPARVQEQPSVDIDELEPGPGLEGGSWIYVEERGEWVRVPTRVRAPAAAAPARGEPPLYVERIIKIPQDRLVRGESKFNIVVRPNDRIFLKPPDVGVVYIEGQIGRPGTYNMPSVGIFTLSRLVAAAGGLGALAIPERVDLVRIVGENREAVVKLNLGAIRQRTEPDVLLKADDHIIIGTNWVATPLAIIRSGFRATYGFGFLLDRNFGNDVFGAPPFSRE